VSFDFLLTYSSRNNRKPKRIGVLNRLHGNALFVVTVRVPSDELFGLGEGKLGDPVAIVLLHVLARVNVFPHPQAHVGAAVPQRAPFALTR